MVSIIDQIQQRKGELSSFEEQLREQEQIISQREEQLTGEERRLIEETEILPLTTTRQFLLAGQVGAGRVGQRAKEIRREKISVRESGQARLQRLREQIVTARKQIVTERKKAEPFAEELSQAEQFRRGQQIALEGGSVFALQTEAERKGFRSGRSEVSFGEQRLALFKVGTPLFESGSLVGFETEKQTIPLESLEIGKLERLERAGILELSFEEAPTPSGELLFTPTPEPEPSKFQQVLSFTFGTGFAQAKARSLGLEMGTPEFEKQVRSFQTGSTLQSAVFLSFAGIKTPIPKKIALRETREAFFTEFQQPIITPSGKRDVISKFIIETELAPPSIIRTREGGLVFGKIQGAKIEKIISFPALEKQVVTTITTRGSRIGKLDFLTGISRKADVSEIGKIQKTQDFLFQRFAEAETGLPVSKEFVPRILGRGREFELGEIQSFKVAKIDIGKSPTKFEFFPRGKEIVRKRGTLKIGAEEIRINRLLGIGREREFSVGKLTGKFETLSEFKQIAKTEQFDVFAGKLIFKDVGKPFARASGITPELKGVIFRSRKIIDLSESDLGTTILKSVGGRKTPLSTTFAEQINIPLVISKKPIPKIKKPKVSLKKQEPSPVGGIVGLSSGAIGGQLSGITGVNRGFVLDFGRGFEKGLFPFQQKEIAGAQAKDGFKTETGKFEPKIDISIKGLQKFDTGLQKFDTGLKVDTKLDLGLKVNTKLSLGLKSETKLGQDFQTKLISRTKQQQKIRLKERLAMRQFQIEEFGRPRGRIPSRSRRRVSPLRPIKKIKIPKAFEKRKKKERIEIIERQKRVRIRPSFTARILGIKKAAKLDFGFVSPFSLRGLETQIDFITKKKVTKKKVKIKKFSQV